MANFVALPGAIADGNMSTRQFSAVILSEATVDFEVKGTTANTQRPIGVLQNAPDTSGFAAEVAISGVCKMQFGGSITQGDELGVDANGLAVSLGAPASTGGHSGRYVIGQALQTGTSTGVYFVAFQPAYLFTT